MFNSIYHSAKPFERVKYGVLNLANDPAVRIAAIACVPGPTDPRSSLFVAGASVAAGSDVVLRLRRQLLPLW
jgi:hypothetical protein